VPRLCPFMGCMGYLWGKWGKDAGRVACWPKRGFAPKARVRPSSVRERERSAVHGVRTQSSADHACPSGYPRSARHGHPQEYCPRRGRGHTHSHCRAERHRTQSRASPAEAQDHHRAHGGRQDRQCLDLRPEEVVLLVEANDGQAWRGRRPKALLVPRSRPGFERPRHARAGARGPAAWPARPQPTASAAWAGRRHVRCVRRCGRQSTERAGRGANVTVYDPPGGGSVGRTY
jgi:hypothetical protein